VQWRTGTFQPRSNEGRRLELFNRRGGSEFPDYYTRLEQMEEQAKRELGSG
jgi:hypothetical protein